jgi:uncharacterized protein (DUF2141 family)
MRIRHLLVGLSILSVFPSLLWGAGPVRITVTNVKSDQGSVVISIYDSPDNWLGDGWRTRKIIQVAGNRTDDTVTVELQLPAGEYAVSVFQDIDNDGKLARNFLHIPKEPAGLSNNVMPRFGPPRFKDAKFTVGNTPVEQSIQLR